MYQKIKNNLPGSVKLVVVSKQRSNKEILNIYNLGQKIFGENRVEELVLKYNELPKDIKWHMIGHLQGRKVKKIASFTNLIHSVDSLKLLKTINKEAKKNNRTINCLLQIKIAQEESKYGLFLKEAELLLKSKDFSDLKHVKISGIMGMATYSNDLTIIKKEFKKLKEAFVFLKSNYFKNKDYFKEISAGMSGDYELAIEEGSTMVRIGSKIFN
jgi:pyridoxal phosphate enzyme (YggS family)